MFRERVEREARDLGFKQPVVVQFGLEVQKDAAKSDCSAIHEYKLARYGHRAFLF